MDGGGVENDDERIRSCVGRDTVSNATVEKLEAEDVVTEEAKTGGKRGRDQLGVEKR